MPTTAVFLAADGQLKCAYCRQSHSLSSYTVITDVAQRKGILKLARRCFVCLRRHHLSQDCRSSAKYTRCDGRHHTSICNSYTGLQGKGRQQRSDTESCCCRTRHSTPCYYQAHKHHGHLLHNSCSHHNYNTHRLVLLGNKAQHNYIV